MTITSGGTLTKNVTLVQVPGTLAGTVTSSTVGLAGVTVSVPGNGSTTTAANGTYTLSGITPGTYTATYSKTGYTTVTQSVTITSGGTLTKDVVDGPGSHRARHPVRYRDLERVALAGVTVSVPGFGSTTTAANGTYSLSGITPGTYTASYSKTGYITQTPSVTITSGGTLTKNVSLVQVPGTLAGTVTSSTVGLAGVTVSVPGNGSTTTAANGTYTLANIKPGTYTASYSKTGYTTVTQSVTITSGGTLTKDVSMVVANASYLPVYRFYNKKNGSHFYTASEAEKASVIKNLSAVYSLRWRRLQGQHVKPRQQPVALPLLQQEERQPLLHGV